ncbi:MAG: NADP-specific glutamate dehydrogenase [Gammaproteobacteria bacterium]|jgi:glutamate dehydrogenase (NADP+)|nr:NADP-specific glutamate dehydrogenase [Gammaproteobacteria bacterium]MBT3725279.1 NADP-specific glutamate dehydrogenase [Gammaproteobacteria bacterium]MBT4075453.1 NADP-specific glutamate dehydrogenase [Gammaproteobacteria bacterium]MBT4195325.1 NADP-specific glutamate dehydrogenase [Gammaproteobacteria bacterium]MBT4449628.1 NADP-specific glutamate dehydrogenase [Gammaproteobacteria bacterium]
MSWQEKLDHYMTGLEKRNPGEPEFRQAVYEVAASIFPFIEDKPIYHEAQIMERMAEPDRIITFRVCWEDDQGNIRVNRGWRVQNNNAIGPYKGGLRFHPTVTQSILKFLAFEQTFKNSLTGLPMGGGKGGSNFNPKGKSDNEVMRFCQSFMTELDHYIGADMDVPAGDIGVGAREIGYLFGQHKRLTKEFTGVLTGKGMEFGGSLIRVEATGYGAVYMMASMLECNGESLEGKTVCISGSGNVATYATEKINQLGGKVVTLSDSSGFIHDPEGIDAEKLAFVVDLKTVKRGRISAYADEYTSASFYAGERPWSIACDLAIPCATQNEINEKDAQNLLKNGCIGISEGSNMPTEQAAVDLFQQAKILFAPSKAANAGGVAVSGLEMSQNSARIAWKEDELQLMLKDIMQKIHDQCAEYGRESDTHVNYLKGANIGGFIKVADAMLAFGVL